VVTDQFTVEAEIQTSGTQSVWSAGIGVASGGNQYAIVVGPNFIADATALGNTAKTYVTDLHRRAAQIRISKTEEGASLYVDGVKAFDLQPTATAASNNYVRFGILGSASGVG